MTTTLSNLLLICDLDDLGLAKGSRQQSICRPRASPSGALRHLFWMSAKTQPRLPLSGQPTDQCGRPGAHYPRSHPFIASYRIVSHLDDPTLVASSSDVGTWLDGMGAANWQSNLSLAPCAVVQGRLSIAVARGKDLVTLTNPSTLQLPFFPAPSLCPLGSHGQPSDASDSA